MSAFNFNPMGNIGLGMNDMMDQANLNNLGVGGTSYGMNPNSIAGTGTGTPSQIGLGTPPIIDDGTSLPVPPLPDIPGNGGGLMGGMMDPKNLALIALLGGLSSMNIPMGKRGNLNLGGAMSPALMAMLAAQMQKNGGNMPSMGTGGGSSGNVNVGPTRPR